MIEIINVRDATPEEKEKFENKQKEIVKKKKISILIYLYLKTRNK